MTDVAAALDRLAALAHTLGVPDDDLAAIIRETIAENADGDATFDDRLIEARARLMRAAVGGLG